MIKFLLVCVVMPLTIAIAYFVYVLIGMLVLEIVWYAYERFLDATGDFVDGTEEFLWFLMDIGPFVWPVALPIIGVCMIYRTIFAWIKKFWGRKGQ